MLWVLLFRVTGRGYMDVNRISGYIPGKIVFFLMQVKGEEGGSLVDKGGRRGGKEGAEGDVSLGTRGVGKCVEDGGSRGQGEVGGRGGGGL